MDVILKLHSNVPMDHVLHHHLMDLVNQDVNHKSLVQNMLHIYVLMDNVKETKSIVKYKNPVHQLNLIDVLI